MKKIILAMAILAMALMASVAWSAPFLRCDDPPAAEKVTQYEVFQDGVSLGFTPAPLNFNLTGITPGAYNFTAKAINVWGSSSPSNPYISPTAAGQPSGLLMED
jgi:hypothetical protein